MISRKIAAALFSLSAIWSVASAQTAYLIEAEAFQFKGKWVVEKSSNCLGSAMLRVYQDNDNNPESDAITVVNIEESGNYNIWIRSQDFDNSPRPRTFTLSVDDMVLEEAGNHGFAGFYWQKVGNLNLSKKKTLLRLTDTGGYFGRCDAVLVVRDSDINPNELTNAQIAKWRINPFTLEYETEYLPALSEPLDITSGYSTVASVANDNIRISFVKLTDGTIVCKNDHFADGSWRRYSGSAEDNRVAIISNKESISYNHNSFYPSWDSCRAARRVTIDGKTYNVNIDGDKNNPFFAGDITEARVRSVSKPDARTIRIVYECASLGTLTGYWHVPETGSHVNVRFEFRPLESGTYSIVLHGLKGVGKSSVNNVLLPPMFCGSRMPESAMMLFSSMMSQCVSCVEYASPSGNVSSFICADLDTFTDDWGSYDYSPVGFTLKNSRNEFEPVAFSPVPGMKDSNTKGNMTIVSSFNIGLVNGDWSAALEYVSDNIFNVTDYRKHRGCSLTGTLYNISRLIKNDEYSGWDSSMKGFWDIEADGKESPTVVQASPLSIIGAAVMMNDEELYIKRALPTIEYSLSRNGYRFCKTTPQTLDPINSQFPTTLYEGLNKISGGLNPWLESMALPAGKIRAPKGYFCNVLPFRQELSAYEMTGDQGYLDKAVSLADAYVSEISGGNSQIFAQGSFYNSQMSPEWQSLLDIYRVTGNADYLNAAEIAAAHTIAGIKTWPKVSDGAMTIHPGNRYDGVTTIWWKGTEQYRLGFPRKDGDAPEHIVNAWEVSSVGLGMEQPATYFVRSSGKAVRPVYMSNWAPGLSELAGYTGKEIYNIYSDNAIIGRAMNYPGYYATGYTDIISSLNFPYEGPDVSSIYYHHIPAYWGMIQDKLISGIISGSNGLINFPAARQEGFVWFSNNIYGGVKGEILGNEATLWMPEDLIEVDNINVSHITARGHDRLYLILSNDSRTRERCKVILSDIVQTKISGNYATANYTDGSSAKVSVDNNCLNIDVPANGLVIAEFDACFDDQEVAPVLKEGFKTLETETSAGKVYLYRIRSPFGWDSIYGFADCGDVKSLRLEIECNGESKNVASWPYEFSFSKFGYDEKVSIRIRVIEKEVAVKCLESEFNVSHSGMNIIQTDNRFNFAKGIFRADGIEVKNMDLPGLYIVNGRKVLKTNR